MSKISMLGGICLMLSVTSCASIVEGSSQEVMVNSAPSGAHCDVYRLGVAIAEISKTPGSATIKKRNKPIAISCSKPGYETTTAVAKSDLAAWNLGNIVIGGLIGFTIDWIDGAWNKYDSPVTVALPASAPGTPPNQDAPNAS